MLNQTITKATRNVVCMTFLALGVANSIVMLWKSGTSFYTYLSVVIFTIFAACYWIMLTQLPNPTKPFGYLSQFMVMFGIALPFDLMMMLVMLKIYVK